MNALQYQFPQNQPMPETTITAHYPFTLWIVFTRFGDADLTAREPAASDPFSIFDDAVDRYADDMDEYGEAWVYAMTFRTGVFADVTGEARGWLKARLNQRGDDWPEWLEDDAPAIRAVQ